MTGTPLPDDLRQALERLAVRCTDAASLARELEPLRREFGAHRDSIDAWAASIGAEPDRAAADLPHHLGHYRVLEQLGRGGMGVVYKAEQREPVRRLVAIKVVQRGLATAEVLARFQLERRALAAMSHRCIAKVLDAGATDNGEPYFVMELVEGLPITEYCNKHRLGIPERLRLFQLVCDGVQHAHLKGVVHRDLKPSNVLVVREGEQPVPKILDFGLAKATNRDFLDVTLFTEKDRVLGTPEYMSPEQAAGDGEVIDARSDVYSLGVMLYELMCGELPFPTELLRKAGQLEALRMLREQEPDKPSTKVRSRSDTEALAEQRRTSVPALRRALTGDLDWIALKAMRKEPEGRYDAATALAADIARHLQHLPVLAGPPSAAYRLRKFMRRFRVQVTAAGVVLLALLGGATGVFLQYVRAEQKVAEFDLLAGVVQHERLVAATSELHPPWVGTIGELVRWRGDADRLLAMQAQVERTVQSLQQDAAGGSRNFLCDQLVDLSKHLDALRADLVPRMEQRLRWAADVTALSLHRPNARHSWADARAAIARADGRTASRLYAGNSIDLRDEDVLGLVPIGRNPQTGLWEFYDVRSAWDGVADAATIAIPEHGPDGSIAITEATGIVFVLVPGGTFQMGQALVPTATGDPSQAEDDETPGVVTLSPFFIARHEMTQAQWLRLGSGANPSRWQGYRNELKATVDRRHPVETIDWHDAERLLRHHGMQLPTEAQWEYAARAGTTTVWWLGDAAALPSRCNLADRALHELSSSLSCHDWSDGHAISAPVDWGEPNAFGLHCVSGNVWEWCMDWKCSYATTPRPGSGLREPGPADAGSTQATERVLRGGSYFSMAIEARSANRMNQAPTGKGEDLGVRPVRRLR